MKCVWHVSDADVDAVKQLLASEQKHPWVQNSYRRNLRYPKAEVSQSAFWEVLVCMRLTTLAWSGEGSRIDVFQRSKPFPLSLDRVLAESASVREEWIHQTLTINMVGTHRKKIAAELSKNFVTLDGGLWAKILEGCNSLISESDICKERRVADLLQDHLLGIGPKQARNILQDLGLTRFEIPIDSRVMKWINSNNILPLQVTSAALSDRNYYHFILDAIQELCKNCETFPCLLDASIFSSLEGAG
jgi:hypothetical protein